MRVLLAAVKMQRPGKNSSFGMPFFKQTSAKAYSEFCQTSMMELFAKTVNGFQLPIIFSKISTLNVWYGSDHVSSVELFPFYRW